MSAESSIKSLVPRKAALVALAISIVVLGLVSLLLPAVTDGVSERKVSIATRSQHVIAGREVVTYTGHMTGAISLDWSSDNTTLALGSLDGTLHFLDTTSGAVTDLDAHKGALYALAWSPDGQTLATAGEDSLVRLWKPDGTSAATLTGHRGSIPGVAWLSNGQLASTSSNIDLYTWDTSSMELSVRRGEGNFLTSLALSPDGKLFAAGSNDKSVRIWNSDGTLIKNLYGHTSEVFTVDWSPDGQLLASGSNDNTVRLWNTQGDALTTLTGHESFVNSVAWSPDGATLASAGDTTVRLWERDGTLREVLHHTDPTLTVAWSRDGRTLAVITSNSSVWLWRMA